VPRINLRKIGARAAVGGLTLGLAALAGLALWSTDSTAQTTAWLREHDAVSDRWGRTLEAISVESEALTDFLMASDEIGRSPLKSALRSAEEHLSWLEAHGDPTDEAQARSVHDSYRSYTESLSYVIELTDAGAGEDEVAAEVQQAGLGAASLRKLAMFNQSRKRLERNAYLEQVDIRNQRAEVAAKVIGGVDFLLLMMCGAVLLGYQRRIERQAGESRHQALHDGLTGVANRVLLNDRIEQALRAGHRHGEAVGLLLLDLNRFKEINDTLGHHKGDILLQHVAARLSGAVRDYDTVARLGGDEFAVLLPRVGSAEHAMEVAHRVLNALQCPADLDGIVVDVSGSIGLAVYPTHSVNAETLLQHADVAMYVAKRGHLGVAMYDPAADHHSVEQLGLIGELRRAIDEGELVLHFQPKLDVRTGVVCGAEALVRWQHPTRGLVPPNDFIPKAEQSDLIHPLTEYVMHAALRQHREWLADGMRVPVAVNIATRCLLDPDFPARVRDLLAEHEVSADQLTLEITESALIADPVAGAAVLGRLRDLGVRLSIDDFGTGYSSMAYLQSMPLHEIKIDRRFVASLATSSGDEAIVRAILDLARGLDLEVVAEGVEDEDTRASLAAIGCELAQGYHFCRPAPAADLTGWLAQHRCAPDRSYEEAEPAIA